MISTLSEAIDAGYSPYEARGGCAQLFGVDRTCEVLLEGAAGTGKSRAGLERVCSILTQYPYTRWLLCRLTRKSMTETILPILEDEVLPAYENVLVPSKAHRNQRSSYEWQNGSVLVIQGAEDFRSLMSAQYDGMLYAEATDGTEEAWEYMISRGLGRKRDQSARRVSRVPFKLAIAECNPDREDHWLNLRADAAGAGWPIPGRMLRILTHHADNPGNDDGVYVTQLAALKGPRRDRLYLGRWISAEGLILPNWQRGKHLVAANDVPELPDYYVGSLDWGRTAAGAMQVWACFHENGPKRVRRAWRVSHTYQSERSLSWWSDEIEWAWRTYQPFKVCVADPARPDLIEHMNERLSPIVGRSGKAAVVVGADNTKNVRSGEKGDMVGLDLLRWSLDDAEDGRPRSLYVRDSLHHGVDVALRQARKPTSLEGEAGGSEGEVGSYRWAKKTVNGRVREVPDDGCEDHELDADRYFKNYWWAKDMRALPLPFEYDANRVHPMQLRFAQEYARHPEAYAKDVRFRGFNPHELLQGLTVEPDEDG